MKLVLVRHPAPDIAPGHCYGRLDLPLSPEGEADLPRLAAELAGIAPFQTGRVYTSPARRCLRLAERLSTTPIRDPRLLELDFGGWEGLPWSQIPRDALDRWAADPVAFAPPGGETGASLIRRIRAVCADLRAAGEDCIVVSHGGPLRLMRAMLQDQPVDLLAPSPPFGAIVHVHAATVSTAHSTTTEVAPNTSPVNPPI